MLISQNSYEEVTLMKDRMAARRSFGAKCSWANSHWLLSVNVYLCHLLLAIVRESTAVVSYALYSPLSVEAFVVIPYSIQILPLPWSNCWANRTGTVCFDALLSKPNTSIPKNTHWRAAACWMCWWVPEPLNHVYCLVDGETDQM